MTPLPRLACLSALLIAAVMAGDVAGAQTFNQQQQPQFRTPSGQPQQPFGFGGSGRQQPQQQQQADPTSTELLNKGIELVEDGKSDQAIEVFQEAAAKGNVLAMLNLGQMLEAGAGVSPDPASALYWFNQAAQRGNGMAAFKVGNMMHYGAPGLAPDKAEAARYYTLASRLNGPAEASGRLGMMLLHGEGVQRDIRGGSDMLYQAAEKGDPDSMFNYGLLLLNGTVGQRDHNAFQTGLMYLEAARISAPPHKRSRIQDAINKIVVDMDFKARMYYQDAARDWLSRK